MLLKCMLGGGVQAPPKAFANSSFVSFLAEATSRVLYMCPCCHLLDRAQNY